MAGLDPAGQGSKSEHGYTLGWEPLQEYLEIFAYVFALGGAHFRES